MKRAIHPCPPAAVIFDMDGVLCDTRLFHLRAFQELCGRHGRMLTAAEFQNLFGIENSVLIPMLLGEGLDAATVCELADWKEARYREMIADEIELMPGVREMVGWLSETGRPAAVASSAPRANVEQILSATGLIDQLQAFLGQEDVSRHKPDPEVFLTAAARIGAAPAGVWIIEDTLHGIKAGHAAGMTVLAVATTHPATELTSSDGVFQNVADIFEALIRPAAGPGGNEGLRED